MSKNFELMQRIGVEEKPFAEPRIETRVHVEESVAATYKPRPILGLNQMSREQTLKLIQRVFLLQSELAPRLVVFAGIEQGNGCSQVCSDAAKILAMNVSGSVCLVDANLRAPSLADTFHIPNHNGLTDALCGDQPVRHFTSPLGPENLSLLSSGSFFEDSSKLLNSVRSSANRLHPGRCDSTGSDFGWAGADSGGKRNTTGSGARRDAEFTFGAHSDIGSGA